MTSATKILSLSAQAEALATRTQATVCAAVERLEAGGAQFREDNWTRAGGGGGRSRVLRDGQVFESAGVNVAVVHGPLPREMAEIARGDDGRLEREGLHFWATGVSIVLHARNPMVPTAHANYRYFELARADGGEPISRWFGGGADLTPAYLFEDDARHFHAVHKEACDRHDPCHYRRFKARCDEYFRLPHRDECRGVGGIFFDRLEDGDPAELLAVVTSCAEAFEPAYFPIVERRKELPFNASQLDWQRVRRGRYVEFNLLYDRGTHFGLRTGGRTESILMSLPPLARWEYSHEPAADSDEAKLLEALRTPREWA
jgi:coproporphyrinogen III oxidase